MESSLAYFAAPGSAIGGANGSGPIGRLHGRTFAVGHGNLLIDSTTMTIVAPPDVIKSVVGYVVAVVVQAKVVIASTALRRRRENGEASSHTYRPSLRHGPLVDGRTSGVIIAIRRSRGCRTRLRQQGPSRTMRRRPESKGAQDGRSGTTLRRAFGPSEAVSHLQTFRILVCTFGESFKSISLNDWLLLRLQPYWVSECLDQPKHVVHGVRMCRK